MRIRIPSVLWLVLVLGTVTRAAVAVDVPGEVPHQDLAFEANRGQTDAQVRYLARGAGFAVFLTPAEAVVQLGRGSERAVLRLRPVGAGANPRPVRRRRAPGRGPLRAERAGAADQRADLCAVRYGDVYPGVDLVYYGRAAARVRLRRRPRRRPGTIALALRRRRALALDERARSSPTLAPETPTPRRSPTSGEAVPGRRVTALRRRRLGARAHPHRRLRPFTPARDRSRAPYSTYLGGSNDEARLCSRARVGLAVDPAGNAYVTGTTFSADFPTTLGAPQRPAQRPGRVRTQFCRPAVVYSTYRRRSCDDVGYDIAVDGGGNAYITGRANGGCALSSTGRRAGREARADGDARLVPRPRQRLRRRVERKRHHARRAGQRLRGGQHLVAGLPDHARRAPRGDCPTEVDPPTPTDSS